MQDFLLSSLLKLNTWTALVLRPTIFIDCGFTRRSRYALSASSGASNKAAHKNKERRVWQRAFQ